MYIPKKAVAVTVIFVFLVSILSACLYREENSDKDVSQTLADTTQTEDVPKEHLEISISWWGISDAFEKRDDMLTKLEKDFNITFKPMQIGWNDYIQKSAIWAVSDQLPDIITHSLVNDYPVIFTDWINEKLIRPLPDDLSKYPNVQKVTQVQDVQNIYKSGKLYALPRLTYWDNDMWALDRGIWVRKDWMENLGIKDPKNFDEFAAMVKAFAEDDPDGNGKQDTIGLVMNNMYFFMQVFVPTFPQIGNNSWLKEDGRWIPPYASKKMYDVVPQARKLFTEGGMDKEFAVKKDGDSLQKFVQGEAGVFVAGIRGDKRQEWKKYNPSENFFEVIKPLHLWPSEDGNTYRFTTTTFWSESMFSVNVDDKKMERILELYNFLLSPEGRTLFDYGIEGKDYKIEGGKIIITRPLDKQGTGFVSLADQYPSREVIMQLASWGQERLYEDNEANRINFKEDTVDLWKNEMDWQMQNAKPIPSAWEIFTMSTPSKDKFNTPMFHDELTKVILGQEDPTQMWQNVMDKLNRMGLQDAITEVNEALKND